jgi:hypothetical protein
MGLKNTGADAGSGVEDRGLGRFQIRLNTPLATPCCTRNPSAPLINNSMRSRWVYEQNPIYPMHPMAPGATAATRATIVSPAFSNTLAAPSCNKKGDDWLCKPIAFPHTTIRRLTVRLLFYRLLNALAGTMTTFGLEQILHLEHISGEEEGHRAARITNLH